MFPVNTVHIAEIERNPYNNALICVSPALPKYSPKSHCAAILEKIKKLNVKFQEKMATHFLYTFHS